MNPDNQPNDKIHWLWIVTFIVVIISIMGMIINIIKEK